MLTFSLFILVFSVSFAGVRYINKVQRREDGFDPTIATWILFTVATGLGLPSLFSATHIDFTHLHEVKEQVRFAGTCFQILDFLSCFFITTFLFLKGKRVGWDKYFDTGYVIAAICIFLYWFLSGKSVEANMISQVLITLGYAPTVTKMIKEKRNTEHFTNWFLFLIPSIASLYIAYTTDNRLSVFYSWRSAITTALMMCVMAFFQFFNKRTR